LQVKRQKARTLLRAYCLISIQIIASPDELAHRPSALTFFALHWWRTACRINVNRSVYRLG
jgi:hypothetical protein